MSNLVPPLPPCLSLIFSQIGLQVCVFVCFFFSTFSKLYHISIKRKPSVVHHGSLMWCRHQIHCQAAWENCYLSYSASKISEGCRRILQRQLHSISWSKYLMDLLRDNDLRFNYVILEHLTLLPDPINSVGLFSKEVLGNGCWLWLECK